VKIQIKEDKTLSNSNIRYPYKEYDGQELKYYQSINIVCGRLKNLDEAINALRYYSESLKFKNKILDDIIEVLELVQSDFETGLYSLNDIPIAEIINQLAFCKEALTNSFNSSQLFAEIVANRFNESKNKKNKLNVA
jgi:hypothetical protein